MQTQDEIQASIALRDRKFAMNLQIIEQDSKNYYVTFFDVDGKAYSWGIVDKPTLLLNESADGFYSRAGAERDYNNLKNALTPKLTGVL